MANPNAKAPEHTKWKPGQSGNPKGKPKGSKHLSTWIQEMLNDEDFETVLTDSKRGIIDYKGAPLKAIIKVAIHKAIHDKDRGQQWAEWLAKHGYGTKLNLEVTDTRKDILERYGLPYAGQTEAAEGRPPQDTT